MGYAVAIYKTMRYEHIKDVLPPESIVGQCLSRVAPLQMVPQGSRPISPAVFIISTYSLCDYHSRGRKKHGDSRLVSYALALKSHSPA